MINIIMLTKDRPKLLRQALVTLYDTTPVDEFGLVLVDDYSTDDATEELICIYSSYDNFQFCRPLDDSHVLARAKNYGVTLSDECQFPRGDYLLLCDNDVAFLPNWWKQMRFIFNAPAVQHPAVLGGSRHPYHQPKHAYDGWSSTDAVAGTSQMMPWYIWDAFGPLEGNAAGTCQSEDFAFCQKVRAGGFEVGYIDNACILDCGITQTNGQPSPGADVKPRMEGYLYL